MSEVSAITDGMRKLLNVEVGPKKYEVERDMIKKLADAIGDDNPLWQDEEYAKKGRHGAIIASPTFLALLRLEEMLELVLSAECSLTRMMNGGTELEYFLPIKVGDVISVTGKIIDIYERDGKSGKMIFIISEMTYNNQMGEITAKARNTFLRY